MWLHPQSPETISIIFDRLEKMQRESHRQVKTFEEHSLAIRIAAEEWRKMHGAEKEKYKQRYLQELTAQHSLAEIQGLKSHPSRTLCSQKIAKPSAVESVSSNSFLQLGPFVQESSSKSNLGQGEPTLCKKGIRIFFCYHNVKIRKTKNLNASSFK